MEGMSRQASGRSDSLASSASLLSLCFSERLLCLWAYLDLPWGLAPLGQRHLLRVMYV